MARPIVGHWAWPSVVEKLVLFSWASPVRLFALGICFFDVVIIILYKITWPLSRKAKDHTSHESPNTFVENTVVASKVYRGRQKNVYIF